MAVILKDGGRQMMTEYDPSTTPEQVSKLTWPGFPTTSTEFITLIAHYYRAEIARMAGWRDRIDRTSNWAIYGGRRNAVGLALYPHRPSWCHPVCDGTGLALARD